MIGRVGPVSVCCLLLVIPALIPAGVVSSAPIHDAARAGDPAAVTALLARDSTLVTATDENGRTALHFAAAGGQLPVARLLLDRGAPLEALTPVHKSALNLAAESGQAEMVGFLVARGANLENRDNRGRTPLIAGARERGGVPVIAALLDAGAAIDALDRSGASALALAAWRGYGDVVDLLLDRGAGLPAQPEGRARLIQQAAGRGLPRLFGRLVEAGADLSATTPAGESLLHAAAGGGATAIVEALVERGLDAGAVDANGWTPLHFAADMGRGEVVKLLLARGAAIDARTRLGQTALNVATERDDPEMVALLRAQGADPGPPRFPELTGPYLGQGAPPPQAQPFAPGVVGGHYGQHTSVALSPDGTEAFWGLMIPPRGSGYGSGRTLRSRLVAGRWTYPEPAVFAGVAVDDAPIIHPDGRRLYDMSFRLRPDSSNAGAENIWVWQRTGEAWGDPRPLENSVNGRPLHWQFGVDRRSDLYVALNVPGTRGNSDIWVCRHAAGGYAPPENLGEAVNTAADETLPFITADGGTLLFGRDSDLYVSFRDAAGAWTPAVPLGPEVNGPGMEMLASISPDGRALFFNRDWRTYWIDAGVIGAARNRSASR